MLYPNVDGLMAKWKKIIAKSPDRTPLFKNKAPDITPSNCSNYTLGNLAVCQCVLCKKNLKSVFYSK
jgi:hypothetical protein